MHSMNIEGKAILTQYTRAPNNKINGIQTKQLDFKSYAFSLRGDGNAKFQPRVSISDADGQPIDLRDCTQISLILAKLRVEKFEDDNKLIKPIPFKLPRPSPNNQGFSRTIRLTARLEGNEIRGDNVSIEACELRGANDFVTSSDPMPAGLRTQLKPLAQVILNNFLRAKNRTERNAAVRGLLRTSEGNSHNTKQRAANDGAIRGESSHNSAKAPTKPRQQAKRSNPDVPAGGATKKSKTS